MQGGKRGMYYTEIYINKNQWFICIKISRYREQVASLKFTLHMYEKRNANSKLISNKKLVSQMS